jgi:hypothetical protein
MRICIAGDSWGCGEWGKNAQKEYTVLHRGLEQYLRDRGHTVDNLSEGSISNKESIGRVMSNEKLYDFTLWFQTDPLRDLRPYDIFKEQHLTHKQLVNLSNDLLNESYSRLTKPVLCIGGCSKLNLNLMSNYTNLYPLIASVPEMLIPKFKHPRLWQSDWAALVDRQFDGDSLRRLAADKQRQDRLFAETELFWPDGRHPNRQGHKVLCDYICNKLSL